MATTRRGGSPSAARTGQGRLGVDYSRYSTEQQGSVDEQRTLNDEVADDADVKIVARFADEGLSRSLSERPELRLMFEYLEQHPEVGFIIVNELERLTAGIGQRDEIVRLCKRLDITILTEDLPPIDPFDDDAMHRADERAVRAAGEVLKIRRRTRRALRQKVMSGTVARRPAFGTRMQAVRTPDGSEVAPGLRLVDARGRKVSSGVLEVHPDEIEWLRRIFDWADEGVSNDEICRKLNDAQVPTKSRRGPWRGNTVAGILKNPLYKGEMIWGHQETIRDADGNKSLQVRADDDPARVVKLSPLGALVDPALWTRVNEATELRRQLPRRVYGPQLFDDLVHCARCGHKMYGRNDAAGERDRHRNVVKWRYFCYSGRPGYVINTGYTGLCTRTHSMSEKKILQALAFTPDDLPALFTVRAVTSGSTAGQRNALRKLVDDLEREQQQAVRVLLKGLISDEEFAADKEVRESALASATAKLQALENATMQPLTVAPQRTAALIEMIDLLADVSLPVADRRSALARFGVQRLYIDHPRVVVELLSGYA